MAATVTATLQHGRGRSRHDVVTDDGRRSYNWTRPWFGADQQAIRYQAWITKRDQRARDERLEINT